jgi:hypothetical protein
MAAASWKDDGENDGVLRDHPVPHIELMMETGRSHAYSESRDDIQYRLEEDARSRASLLRQRTPGRMNGVRHVMMGTGDIDIVPVSPRASRVHSHEKAHKKDSNHLSLPSSTSPFPQFGPVSDDSALSEVELSECFQRVIITNDGFEVSNETANVSNSIYLYTLMSLLAP